MEVLNEQHIRFFVKNLVNLGLVIVGSFAMIVYKLQERKKRIEAASLIVLQIDECELLDKI